MSIKNAFSGEVKPGTLVTVWFGLQPPVTGVVIHITDELVRLECEAGSPRISLDSIIAYDLPQTADTTLTSVDAKEANSINEEACDSISDTVTESPEPREISPELMRLTAIFEGCSAPCDEECADLEGTAADLRDCDNSDLRCATEGIVSSFTGLRRQNPENPDMHNIRARTLKLILDNPDHSELLYCLLGSMYYLLGEYENACDYFSRGGDLLGAIYSALHTGDKKALADALEEYTALPELPEVFVLKLYAEHVVRTKQLGALKYHVDSIRYAAGELDEEADMLVSAAALITALGGLCEQWLGELKNSPLAALDAFFAALPEDWSCDSSCIALECDFDEYHVDPKRAVGEIVKYSDQKHCGFIGEEENDCFFYFGQIPEDEPLRELLCAGLWQKLEVSYLYGMNHTNHSRAAYDVRLTPRMKAEVEKRKKELDELNVTLTGYIESGEFNCRSGFGRISCGDKYYSVRRAEIIDPLLWASMTGNIRYSFKVEFRPVKLKDRYGAADIRSAEPIELSEYDLNQAITSGEITRAAIDRWADRKAKLEQPEGNDEHKIKYLALTPWSERDKTAGSSFRKSAVKSEIGRIMPEPKAEDAKPAQAAEPPVQAAEPPVQAD